MTTASPRIEQVSARRVWDSRGRPTVEAEVRLGGGVIGRAIAPAGASTGSGEVLDLRDGGTRLGGHDVTAAVRNVNEEIAPALRGRDVTDQAGLDQALVDLDGTDDKSRLGGNALIATSLAALHAAAGAAGLPLWRTLLGDCPCPAAAARDPDLRRRRPRGTPRRHSGLHGDAGRGLDLRAGARVDGRGVSGRRRADGAGRAAAGRRRRGRLLAGVRHQRGGAGVPGPRHRGRRPCPATTSPSRSTSPPRSSTTRVGTNSAWKDAPSTAMRSSSC